MRGLCFVLFRVVDEGFLICPSVVSLLRHIERRIAAEEPARNHFETDVCDGHDRPLFGTRNVRYAQGVPDDDISVFNRFIVGDELR